MTFGGENGWRPGLDHGPDFRRPHECHCKQNGLASGWCCCYEGWPCTLCGEGGGGGGGGGRRCNDLRDVLAEEYRVRPHISDRPWYCDKFRDLGPSRFIVHGPGIENGRTHGSYGYLHGELTSGMGAVEAKFGRFRITSGYRCPIGNGLVGGSRDSRHIRGRAVDFDPRGVTRDQVRRFVEDDDLGWGEGATEGIRPRVELILYPTGHMHLGWWLRGWGGGGGGGGGGGLEHGGDMMTTTGRAASAALATALATGGAAAQSADDQLAVVRELLSGDWETVADALGRLPPIPGGCEYCGGSGEVAFEEGYQTPELASALIAALEHEIRRARQAGWGRGMFEREGHPEIISWLAHAVAATRNPGALDVLIDARMWGVAVDPSATFGARAEEAWLSRTLENARNPEADESAAFNALMDLRTEAYGSREGGEALEPWLQEAMREVAILHLERDAALGGEIRDRELLFDGAVGLAFALRDPEVDAALRTACEGGRCPPCPPGSNRYRYGRFCVMDPVEVCERWRPPAGSAHEPYAKRSCARSHEKAEYMQRITGLTYSRPGKYEH